VYKKKIYLTEKLQNMDLSFRTKGSSMGYRGQGWQRFFNS